MSGVGQAVFMNQRSFIVVPGAPTIGTATATGATTATVAFTAPANNGGTAITLYTATSTPDGITGTLSQAGSGTITVTGLTGGTSYTFTVRATNAVGEGPASAASNSITTATIPVNTVLPVITGTAQAGQTLSVSNGTWTGTTPITFTYQWQRVTTNISGATSSSYTPVGADVGNTIRCVVTATNAAAAVSVNTANTATVSFPAIGAAFGGGFFAGQISTTANGVATHNLVIGPLSTAQSTLRWQLQFPIIEVPGANSDINGPQNTADMVAAGGAEVFQCAHFCNNLFIGGFSDFYMPANNELEVCYFNLKPTTNNNFIGAGINPNAVPARASGYTGGNQNPARTSAAAFQAGGAQAFTADFYMSSTQAGAGNARGQDFPNGDQRMASKFDEFLVRAVRRVAV